MYRQGGGARVIEESESLMLRTTRVRTSLSYTGYHIAWCLLYWFLFLDWAQAGKKNLFSRTIILLRHHEMCCSQKYTLIVTTSFVRHSQNKLQLSLSILPDPLSKFSLCTIYFLALGTLDFSSQ